MRTEDYLKQKLRLLIIQMALNVLGTAALLAIAVVLWMLWAGGKL